MVVVVDVGIDRQEQALLMRVAGMPLTYVGKVGYKRLFGTTVVVFVIVSVDLGGTLVTR